MPSGVSGKVGRQVRALSVLPGTPAQSWWAIAARLEDPWLALRVRLNGFISGEARVERGERQQVGGLDDLVPFCGSTGEIELHGIAAGCDFERAGERMVGGDERGGARYGLGEIGKSVVIGIRIHLQSFGSVGLLADVGKAVGVEVRRAYRGNDACEKSEGCAGGPAWFTNERSQSGEWMLYERVASGVSGHSRGKE